MTFQEAMRRRTALTEALAAMSNYGSDEDDRLKIGEMLVEAHKDEADAYRTHEKVFAPDRVSGKPDPIEIVEDSQ